MKKRLFCLVAAVIVACFCVIPAAAAEIPVVMPWQSVLNELLPKFVDFGRIGQTEYNAISLLGNGFLDSLMAHMKNLPIKNKEKKHG